MKLAHLISLALLILALVFTNGCGEDDTDVENPYITEEGTDCCTLIARERDNPWGMDCWVCRLSCDGPTKYDYDLWCGY